MPTLEVTTKKAELVWESPDKQRKIHKVTLDYKGKEVEAKTYSEQIATEGWDGTVETYEKEGLSGRPAQTFVKQPPKEGGYSSDSTSGSGRNKYQKDEAAIKAMFAIKGAIELAKLNPKATILDVEANARQLFDMVDRVKAPLEDEEVVVEKDEVHQPKDSDDPLTEDDLKKIDEIFGPPEKPKKEKE